MPLKAICNRRQIFLFKPLANIKADPIFPRVSGQSRFKWHVRAHRHRNKTASEFVIRGAHACVSRHATCVYAGLCICRSALKRTGCSCSLPRTKKALPRDSRGSPRTACARRAGPPPPPTLGLRRMHRSGRLCARLLVCLAPEHDRGRHRQLDQPTRHGRWVWRGNSLSPQGQGAHL